MEDDAVESDVFTARYLIEHFVTSSKSTWRIATDQEETLIDEAIKKRDAGDRPTIDDYTKSVDVLATGPRGLLTIQIFRREYYNSNDLYMNLVPRKGKDRQILLLPEHRGTARTPPRRLMSLDIDRDRKRTLAKFVPSVETDEMRAASATIGTVFAQGPRRNEWYPAPPEYQHLAREYAMVIAYMGTQFSYDKAPPMEHIVTHVPGKIGPSLQFFRDSQYQTWVATVARGRDVAEKFEMLAIAPPYH